MRKYIFVLFLLISTLNIYSQANVNISTNVGITLSNGIALNKIKGDLDFGNVLYTGSSLNLSKTANLGIEYEITGFRNRNVNISYSSSVNLTNAGWVNLYGGTIGILRFTPKVTHTGGNINYVGAVNLSNNSRVKLTNTKPLGKLYIWIGGNIIGSANRPYGDYSGTFTLTVAY